MTSRADDMRIFQEVKNLAQPALQNGASLYEVAQMFTETSTRKLMDTYKKLKEKQESMMQQQQQMEQQAQEMQQQQLQQQQEFEVKKHDDAIKIKTYEIDTKANTELTIAQMQERIQIAKENQADTSGIDYSDIMAHNLKQQEGIYKRDIESMKLALNVKQQEMQESRDARDMDLRERKLGLEAERNQLEKEKIKKMGNKPASGSK
jgi:hypothetical protein